MNDAKILVADDDREIARAIEALLRLEGYEVVKAHNGLEALDAIVTEKIHLILMDIMMPKMDGLSATMKIREQKNILNQINYKKENKDGSNKKHYYVNSFNDSTKHCLK